MADGQKRIAIRPAEREHAEAIGEILLGVVVETGEKLHLLGAGAPPQKGRKASRPCVLLRPRASSGKLLILARADVRRLDRLGADALDDERVLRDHIRHDRLGLRLREPRLGVGEAHGRRLRIRELEDQLQRLCHVLHLLPSSDAAVGSFVSPRSPHLLLLLRQRGCVLTHDIVHRVRLQAAEALADGEEVLVAERGVHVLHHTLAVGRRALLVGARLHLENHLRRRLRLLDCHISHPLSPPYMRRDGKIYHGDFLLKIWSA
mgnify:CR=1 FL=1